MKNPITQIWIETGYALFAKEGYKGLKVEQLARLVNKNKSSFYHLFAEVDIFMDALLGYHLERAKDITERARRCQKMVPDMLHLFIEVKEDIFFGRQLLFHREMPACKQCFEEANKGVIEAFMEIWAESLGLGEKAYLARIILNLTNENFYLRMSEENLNYPYLLQYWGEIRFMVKEMVKNNPNFSF
jgi:AcrR family transcriptional regulator